MTTHAYRLFIVAALGLFLTTGCTIKGTVNQITDTTSNITGTTSGAAWWNEDGQIKPDFKITAFATANRANLQQDIAAGRGEYLASMSVLLGVPEDRQPVFFSSVQAGYGRISEEKDMELATLLPFLHNAAVASLK